MIKFNFILSLFICVTTFNSFIKTGPVITGTIEQSPITSCDSFFEGNNYIIVHSKTNGKHYKRETIITDVVTGKKTSKIKQCRCCSSKKTKDASKKPKHVGSRMPQPPAALHHRTVKSRTAVTHPTPHRAIQSETTQPQSILPENNSITLNKDTLIKISTAISACMAFVCHFAFNQGKKIQTRRLKQRRLEHI